MTIKSPSVSTLNSLIFSGCLDSADIETFEQQVEALESDRADSDDAKLGCRRPSIYVEAFEGTHQVNKLQADR
jgi:fanconi-associated nuclease 1